MDAEPPPFKLVPAVTVWITPGAPVAPVGPSRKTKFKVAAEDEPALVTEAVPSLATLEVDPTATVAAAPAAPVLPWIPWLP